MDRCPELSFPFVLPASGDPREPPPPDTLATLLQNPSFRFYVGTRVCAFAGLSIQTSAIMWQVYDITGLALPLAFIGLARFLPNLALSFFAGAFADTHDRRAIAAVTQVVPISVSILF